MKILPQKQFLHHRQTIEVNQLFINIIKYLLELFSRLVLKKFT